MDEYLKNCLEGTELMMSTERYSLYINKGTKTLLVYNGEDIWEITLEQLGDLGFME